MAIFLCKTVLYRPFWRPSYLSKRTRPLREIRKNWLLCYDWLAGLSTRNYIYFLDNPIHDPPVMRIHNIRALPDYRAPGMLLMESTTQNPAVFFSCDLLLFLAKISGLGSLRGGRFDIYSSPTAHKEKIKPHIWDTICI